jgi:large subunit ribosomal protein L25
MIEIIRLGGSLRNELGSSVSRKLRKQGKLPAVVYGDKFDSVFFEIDAGEFEKEYFKGGIETRIFEIKIEGGNFKAICCRVDVDPVSDRPIHVDFLSTAGRKEIKTLVPIKFLNVDKAAGLKKGGYFNVLIRKLPLICDVDRIPNFLEVNCENLKLKQSIKLSSLLLPDGSKLVSKKDIMIARIIGRGREESKTTATMVTGPATTTTTANATSTAGTTAASGHGTSRK